MKTNSYNHEQDIKNEVKIRNLIQMLPECVSDYFRSRRTNTSSRTRLAYAYNLTSFFTWYAGFLNKDKPIAVTNDDLAILNARNIETYIDYLQTERSNTSAGVAQKYATLSSFLDYLFRNDIIPANPITKVLNVKKAKDNRIIRLHPNETVSYLNAVEGSEGTFTPRQAKYLQGMRTRDLAIATLFLGTGIRVSELVNINISDVDFENCQIAILRKGNKYQNIAIGDEVIEALQSYMEERIKEKVKEKTSDDALFLSSQKRRMCVQSVENVIVKYAKAIGLPDKITPHKLRKTYGTELYQETGDIYLVARALGHNNVNTTKNHYIAEGEEELLAARNAVKLRR